MGATDSLILPFPELTETADGPAALSALANGVEDFFYDRILPSGVTRAPAYYWGAGTVFPTSGLLRVGDTFQFTATTPVLTWIYVGSGYWRPLGEPIVTNIAARDTFWANVPVGQRYAGFRCYVVSLQQYMEWDNANSLWRGTKLLNLGASTAFTTFTNSTATGYNDVCTFSCPNLGYPYYIRPHVRLEVGNSVGVRMLARLYNVTDAAVIAESYVDLVSGSLIWGHLILNQGSPTISAAKTVKLQVGPASACTWSATAYNRVAYLDLMPVAVSGFDGVTI